VQLEHRRPLPSAEAETAKEDGPRDMVSMRSRSPPTIASTCSLPARATRSSSFRSRVSVGADGRAARARGGRAYRRLPATGRHGQPKTRRLRRTEGTQAVPQDAERCGSVLALADAASRGLCRDFGSARGVRERRRTAMVRKGSPVRVRQRALGNRAAARFSCFRSGSDDHFRAGRGQRWPSVRAAQAFTPRGAAASFGPKVPTRYAPGANLWCDTSGWLSEREEVRFEPFTDAPAHCPCARRSNAARPAVRARPRDVRKISLRA
jgi:hypothetical protein